MRRLALYLLLLTAVPLSSFAARVVLLQWEPTGDATVKGYRVYQSPTSGAYDYGSGFVAELPALADRTTVEVEEGRSWHWVITSVDAAGEESVPSNEVSLDLPPANRPPVFAALAAQSAAELEPLGFTVAASDPDGDGVRFTASGLPAGSHFDGATGVFRWMPSPGQSGAHRVIFTAIDDGTPPLTAELAVTLTVVAQDAGGSVNRAPVLAAIANRSTLAGAVLKFGIKATDPDGDLLTYSVEGLPPGAAFDPARGAFSWTPGPGQTGEHLLVFAASDSSLAASQEVRIAVTRAVAPDQAGSALSLRRQQVLGTGGRPTAVSLCDLDADGRPELAVADAAHAKVLVYRDGGDGYGVYGQQGSGGWPVALARSAAAGAVADVVVANAPDRSSGAQAVSVLRNDGKGKLSEPVEVAAGTVPTALALADVDGDGCEDMVVADAAGDRVVVLLGDGAGGFVEAGAVRAGSAPSAVSLRDLNADGLVDLVVASSGAGEVEVFLGQGDGSFVAAGRVQGLQSPSSLACEDFDGEGRLDLAVADERGREILLYLGDGAGGFAAAARYPVALSPGELRAGDVEGTGHYGLVVLEEGGSTLLLLPGEAGGPFGEARTIDAGEPASAMDLGCADGNWLLAVAHTEAGAVSVFRSGPAVPASDGGPPGSADTGGSADTAGGGSGGGGSGGGGGCFLRVVYEPPVVRPGHARQSFPPPGVRQAAAPWSPGRRLSPG